MATFKEIADAIVSIPHVDVSEMKHALENDIEQMKSKEYCNILSPKEYGMKIIDKRQNRYGKRIR